MTTKIARPSFDSPASEWLVYGDALQEANDVRGELVGLSHAVEEGRTEAGLRDAYVKRHATQLLGRAADQLAHYTLRWQFSELAAVEIRIGPDDDGPALVRAILEAPTAELLTDVTLVGVSDGARRVDLSPAMDLLGGAKRITRLGLVDDRARSSSMLVSRDFDPGENLVTFGSVKPFVDRLVGLSFDVADSYALTDLENFSAPELRAFALRSLRFTDWEDAGTMSSRLATAKWPKLESFELRLVETWIANVPDEPADVYVRVYSAPDHEIAPGEPGYDDVDDGETGGINWGNDLAPILATLKGCPLRRLALTSFDSSDSVLEALEDSGLLPVIEVLDLSDSALREEHADWIVAHAGSFSNLAQLVVERTAIGDAGAHKLASLGPKVAYSAGGGEPSYRYVVGQE